jgi:hypothetical protein
MATIKSPTGIISYPNLFKAQPKGGVAGAENVFSLSLLFDAEAQSTTAFKAMKTAIDELVDAYAKEKKVAARLVRSPLLSGDEKNNDSYHGKLYVSPWSKFQPGVVNEDRQQVLDANDVYAGMKARVVMNPYSWTNSGKHGVSLSLNGVQVFTNLDMPRLDGRQSVEAMFADEF